MPISKRKSDKKRKNMMRVRHGPLARMSAGVSLERYKPENDFTDLEVRDAEKKRRVKNARTKSRQMLSTGHGPTRKKVSDSKRKKK